MLGKFQEFYTAYDAAETALSEVTGAMMAYVIPLLQASGEIKPNDDLDGCSLERVCKVVKTGVGGWEFSLRHYSGDQFSLFLPDAVLEAKDPMDEAQAYFQCKEAIRKSKLSREQYIQEAAKAAAAEYDKLQKKT